jgi:hypothetical protein
MACHMLFVDNVGIFIPALELAFNKLYKCLSLYEAASGAKLNFQKSTIIPIAIENIPDWIHRTGCSILKDGEIHKYLNSPFGNNLSSAATQNFCLEKLGKRIVAFKPRSILFPGRIQFTKQVFLAMPVYNMMYTYLPKKTIMKIKRMWREFL